MTHTETFRLAVAPMVEAILRHQFNTELDGGTLDMRRFAYYLQQHELYLRDYIRALALTAVKAPSSEAEALLTYAREGIVAEQALHRQFFVQYDIQPSNEQQPACFAYSRFLLSTCALDDYEQCLAALLPCFWIYHQVGLAVAQHSAPKNRYAPWIDLYTDPSYQQSVEGMIAMTEAAAENTTPAGRLRMGRLFHRSTCLEWLFWDAAYRLEQWPSF